MKYREKYLGVPSDTKEFTFKSKKYDIELAVRNDMKVIKIDAQATHPEDFDTYDFDKTSIYSVRLYQDDNGSVQFVMITYIMPYKSNPEAGRYACGHYYPIMDCDDRLIVCPHPYQGRICW